MSDLHGGRLIGSLLLC